MRQELDFNRPVITPHEIRDLLRAVRITRENGTFYVEREKKYHEVIAFATHLLVLERDMRRDKELVLVDGGCGKSYLSFVLNHILKHKVGRPVRFIGVDSEPGIIQTCRDVARDLGFDNMAFHQGRAIELDLGDSPDLVYALHACDTATDEVIALAIRSRAMAVAVAPCCQREVQRTLGPRHPMSDVGRFHVFRERFSAMLTDTVRASALEAAGYGVKVIEFVAARHTPKNILLRARRRSLRPNPRAMAAFRRLQGTYGFRSSLETFLPELFRPDPDTPAPSREASTGSLIGDRNPMPDMRVLPTGGALGAEVQGSELSRPLSAQEVNRLRSAFLEHGVLFFRGQRISEEDQVRFSRYFGNPVPHVREQPDRPILEIFIISNVEENGKPIGALGNDEIQFHSDLSYMQKPGSISMLYAIEVPRTGGDTMWANCCAAYEALDDATKARIAGLRAVHLHPRPEQNPPIPAVHPVVRTHPETGRKVLYVSPHLTSHVEGMAPEEGRALLDRLIAHATQPGFVWTHRWQAGDLLMWDNRCTMHRRESFDNSQRRVMKRTQMYGDEPY